MNNFEECGTKALKEGMKMISLTQNVERNIMMEMKYDNRIMVTGMNLLFVTQIQGVTFLSFFYIKLNLTQYFHLTRMIGNPLSVDPLPTLKSVGSFPFPLRLNKSTVVPWYL